jgi:uncharacterized protein (TIGR02145 family)
MKQKIQFLAAIMIFLITSVKMTLAQVAINTDDSSPDNSAMVDVKSTSKGFLPPRMTTLQVNTINAPAEGLVVYNTDLKTLLLFNGDVWTTNTGKFRCGITQVRDAGGNRYNTILIGNQCWMTRNLSVGVMIDSASNQNDNYVLEKYCYHSLAENCEIYGGLYQWGEMMQYHTYEGAQGICPDGWHIPAMNEWETLISTLGGSTIAGGKLKEAGSLHWHSSNTGSNTSGFTGLGSGYREIDSRFYNLLLTGTFWSSSQEDETYATSYDLIYNTNVIDADDYEKTTGLSVRCVKNPSP